MLESLYAKENARWKWRNISLNLQDFVSVLFRVQWSPGRRMAGESKKGRVTIMTRPSSFVSTSFLYPLSPVDTANGTASLCHSKSHFCPPRRCPCWQSEGAREEEKRADRGIFQHGVFCCFFFLPLVNFCAACQKRAALPSCWAGLESCWARGEIRVWGGKKKKIGGAAVLRGYFACKVLAGGVKESSVISELFIARLTLPRLQLDFNPVA